MLPSMLYIFLCAVEGDAGTTLISKGSDRSCGAKYDVLYSSLLPGPVAKFSTGLDGDLRLSYGIF